MEIDKARYSYRQRRGRGRAKRVLLYLFVLLFLGSTSGYITLALQKPVPAVAAEQILDQTTKGDEVTGLAWPAQGQAAFGTASDGVLASSGSEQPKPIASMTKVITALAIMEKSPLEPGQSGQVHTFDSVDESYYRSYLAKYGSVVPTDAGKQVTELQALRTMLVVSANNLADSLVRWHFDSTQEYLDYANGLLDDWGLNNTTVADASGFSPQSVSTPSDMIVLGRKLLANPMLAEIVNMREIYWPDWGVIKNTNQLMANDENALGIKTGNTDEAGSCLMFAYKFGPSKEHIFIGVVMGQPNYPGMFVTAKALMDSAMPNFKATEVLAAGTVVGQISSPWGNSTDVVTVEPLKVYGWTGKDYKVNVEFSQTDVPILKNQIVGQASAGDVSAQLVAKSALDKPNLVWRLANYW